MPEQRRFSIIITYPPDDRTGRLLTPNRCSLRVGASIGSLGDRSDIHQPPLLALDCRRASTSPSFFRVEANRIVLLAGFPIQKLQSRVLHLHVFDYDRFSRDDSIGEVFLPLCQVRASLHRSPSRSVSLSLCDVPDRSGRTDGASIRGSISIRVRGTTQSDAQHERISVRLSDLYRLTRELCRVPRIPSLQISSNLYRIPSDISELLDNLFNDLKLERKN